MDLLLNLSGLSEEPTATKVQALTLCFSRETLTVVDNLGLTTEERNDSSAIIAALKRHVEGHINESMERRRLRRRMQQRKDISDNPVLTIQRITKQHAHYKSPQASQSVLKSCPGCGAQAHQGGRAQCPAFKQTCRSCLKVATLPEPATVGSHHRNIHDRTTQLPKPSQPRKMKWIRRPHQ